MGVAMAATSSFFLASNSQMRQQTVRTETDQAARAAVDMIVRDLRLGGACLPVTGDFISLEGTNSGTEDEIITRTGIVRSDMSCVRTALNATTRQGTKTIGVESTDGFAQGMRVYLREPAGGGEYADIDVVDSGNKQLFVHAPVGQDYPPTSGLYAIDERHFYIDHVDGSYGDLPELMVQVGDAAPMAFAVGIEKLDLHYVLRRNCPPCDVVDLPADQSTWAIVEQVQVALTARSEIEDPGGHFYRRRVSVSVKPRNLLPR